MANVIGVQVKNLENIEGKQETLKIQNFRTVKNNLLGIQKVVLITLRRPDFNNILDFFVEQNLGIVEISDGNTVEGRRVSDVAVFLQIGIQKQKGIVENKEPNENRPEGKGVFIFLKV